MVTKLLTTAMGGHSQNYLLADVPCLSPYGNKKKKGGEAPAVFFKRNITDRGIYSIWENKPTRVLVQLFMGAEPEQAPHGQLKQRFCFVYMLYF